MSSRLLVSVSRLVNIRRAVEATSNSKKLQACPNLRLLGLLSFFYHPKTRAFCSFTGYRT